MADNDYMRIPVATLDAFVTRIFVAAGCADEEAARVSHYLIQANLTGHDSHGVVRVPRYVDMLRDGGVFAGRAARIVFENDSMAVVDGCMGLGQTVTPQAVEIGIAKALASGVAVVALRNAGHIGRCGDWSEMAAAKGLISIHFVNAHGSVLVAPFGGAERRFSTAPFSVGVPREGQPPVILDFATSYVAEGKVLVASNGGKPVPEDSLIGPDGRHTGDPRVLYGEIEGTMARDARKGLGAIRAFGEHKGSGLAFMCEMLGGALTGNGTAGPFVENTGKARRFHNGMLSIYLAPRFFGSPEAFEQAAETYIDYVRAAKPAAGTSEVLVPGDPEQRNRAERTRNGVPMPKVTWDSILAAATKLGVPAPAP
jgi:uncharacterized oxidoreductase